MLWRKLLLLLVIPLATPQLPANPTPRPQTEHSLFHKVADYERILSDESLLRTLPAKEIIHAFDELSTLIHAGTHYVDPTARAALAVEEREARRELFTFLQNRPAAQKMAGSGDAPLRSLVFYGERPYEFQYCGGVGYSCKKVWRWICHHKTAIIIGVVVIVAVVLSYYLISAASAAEAASAGGAAGIAGSSKSKKKPITTEEISKNFTAYSLAAQKQVNCDLQKKLETLPDKKPETIRHAIVDFSKHFASTVTHEIAQFATDFG